MRGLNNVVVACPRCGNRVLFVMEIEWMPAGVSAAQIIPFEKLSEWAAAYPAVEKKRKTLVCPSFSCGRRFSVLVPRPVV